MLANSSWFRWHSFGVSKPSKAIDNRGERRYPIDHRRTG